MANTLMSTYKRASDSVLLSIVHYILGKMEGNANFPTPPAALATLKDEFPKFIALLTASKGGDQEAAAVKNAKKEEIVGLLTELATYIELTSMGDRAKLLSSGFSLNRERGSVLSEISGLEVLLGRKGEATTRVKRVTGAKAYIHRCTIEPVTANSQWVVKVIAEPIYTFTTLESKERYVFEVAAVGANGQETRSPEVTRVIQ